MLTERRAFIEAIKAAPDDDAPKLVWADWLDEHGEGDLAGMIRAMLSFPRREIAVREQIGTDIPGPNSHWYFLCREEGDTPDRALADVFRTMPWEFYYGAMWTRFEVSDVQQRYWQVKVFYDAPSFR